MSHKCNGIIRTLLLLTMLLAAPFVYSQTCSDVVMAVTATDSDGCDKNGSIKVDLSNIPSDLIITEYTAKLISGTQVHTGSIATPNIITGLKAGVYEVKVHGTCSGNLFTKTHSSNVEIKTTWRVPEMKVLINATRKTLNCINTGAFTFYFLGGSAPYSISVVAAPSEYTETNISVSVAGNFLLEDLPPGKYNFTLKDACGSESPTGEIEILALADDYGFRFSNIGGIPGSCKDVIFSTIAKPADYAYYLENNYYEFAFSEDGGATMYTDNVIFDNSRILQFSLRENTYKHYYTNNIKVYVKLKGGTCQWKEINSNYLLPTKSSIANHSENCNTSINLTVRENRAVDGPYNGFAFCFPYTCVVKKKSNGDVVYTQAGIPPTAMSGVPHNIPLPEGEYTIEITSSDGYTITEDWIITKSKPIQSILSIACATSGNVRVSYYINDAQGFPIGTKVTYIEGPNLGEIPQITTTKKTIILFPLRKDDPYTSAAAIVKAGTHKIQVQYCDIDTVFQFELIPPLSDIKISVGNSACDLNKSIMRLTCTGGFEVGSVIEYINGPQVPTHPRIVVTTSQSQVFPFSANFTNSDYSEIEPGTYTFKVYDAGCDVEKDLSVEVTKPYTYENFTFEFGDTTCSGVYLKPKGTIVSPNGTKTSAHLNISGYTDPNGLYDPTWYAWADTRVIREGDSILLEKSGTYQLRLVGTGDSYGCPYYTQDVKLSNLFPSLNKALTASYVCGNSSNPGHIKFVAQGGFANGPYEYTLMDNGAVIDKNMTGIFNYGEIEKTYSVIIVDSSIKARNCPPKFEEEFKMVDLSNPVIAYTSKSNLCVGEAIDLNCITLGITEGVTKYNWVGPKGFTQEGQFLILPNATEDMSGEYIVSVQPEFCGVTVIYDTLNIKVNKIPDLPILTTNDTSICYNSIATILGLTGAVAPSPADSLRWYNDSGNIINSEENIKTNVARDILLTVTSVNKLTGCESAPVNVKITVLPNVLTPNVKSVEKQCPGSSFTLDIIKSDPSLTYIVKFNNAEVDRKLGNGDTLKIFLDYPSAISFYYVSAENAFGCRSLERSVRMEPLEGTTAADIRAESITICFGETAILHAEMIGTGNNPIIRWYDTPFSTTPIHTDISPSTFTPIISVAEGVIEYYVSLEIEGKCETTEANRKIVKVYKSGEIKANLVADPFVWEIGKGAITANASGGLTPYQYNLDNSTWAAVNRFENLNAGEYTVYVKDGNSCEGSESIRLFTLTTPKMIVIDSCSYNPTLSLDVLHIGATYLWEYSTDGTNWLTHSSLEVCQATKDAHYRVNVTFNGKPYLIGPKKLDVIQKLEINNKWWYHTELK